MTPRQIAIATTALLAAAGFVVAAFATWTIQSWHEFGSVPSTFGFERVQYDTAWAFGFIGAALLAQAARQGGFARLLALVPISLGSLRLLAILVPGFIPTQPILANRWLPYGRGAYNDMGVLAALIFVVLGFALAALRPEGRSAVRSLWIAFFAWIALALAMLLLFGAWTVGGIGQPWLPLTGDDRSDALLFLIIAGCLLATRFIANRDEQLAVWRWTPVFVWFAVFTCVLVLWQALSLRDTHDTIYATQQVATDARSQILRELDNRIATLQRLADRAQIYGFTYDQWQQDAALLLGGTAGFQTITWRGPDLQLRWIVPPDKANVLSANLESEPARRAALDLAISTRRPAFTRLVDLVAGGKGFVLFVPAYAAGIMRGVAAGALGDKLLHAILSGRFAEFKIELLERQAVIDQVTSNNPAAGPEWSQDVNVEVANAHWVLRVTPTAAFLRANVSTLPEVTLGVGTLLATLLALSVYLFQSALSRARDLSTVNEMLRADMEARRLAERALQGSEQRTRLIINAIKDCAIFMLDVGGNIVSWNPGAEAINGYSTDEILARPFTILYPPDRVQPPKDQLDTAARQGWIEEECWHVRKDGTRYCGDDIISAITDEQGLLQGFSVVTRDATQRIALREQTERSRDFYFALFSDFPNLVWRSDASGRCDYLNQAWLEFTGLHMESQLGDRWLEHVHPNDRSRWAEIYANVFPARKPFEIEFRLRRADGTFGSMICVGRPYHDMQGSFAGYLCSCYDYTENRQMQVALKDSEERYLRIATNVPGMVFKLVRNAQGKLSFGFVSQGGEALTGLTVKALIADAQSFAELVSPDDRTHMLATLDAAIANLTTWTWSGRLRGSQGTGEKWITIRAQPRRADDGSTVLDGVVFDDTQSRFAQLEIERSREELRALSRHLQSVREEEKARIAREVHDELGATLTALKIDLDWLGEHLPPGMNATREKRDAMSRLVAAAVAATRKIVTDLRPSVLDDLGLAAALRWQASEYQKHADLKVHLETPSPEPVIDREMALTLFRIFQEALTNVLRHAKATQVWVRLGATDSAYILQIRDNGVGFAETEMRKPTSHGIRGMRERAQQLGGDVSVLSEPGNGATLLVSIPKLLPEMHAA